MRRIISIAATMAVAVSAVGLAACHKPAAEGRTLYTMQAEYFPAERRLAAQMTVEFFSPADALSELKFELWPNAYREGAAYAPVSSLFHRTAYYAGESYGGISITGMTGAEGFAVAGEDSNILTATLPEPLEKGEKGSVGISFEVDLAKVNHRLGVTPHGVNLGNFYPILCNFGENGFEEYVYAPSGDPFVSACADYDVTLTLPNDHTLISGFAAEAQAGEEKTVYRVHAENVRDIAFVLGKDYRVVTGEAEGVEVAYYYYGDGIPEAALSVASESLAFYAERFGGYAYPRYAVVETDFVYGGMEYPALSMISSSLQGQDRKQAVAHETAHQWWYAMVGNNQFEHAWQDEGLAEYSSLLFFENHPEYGMGYRDLVAASERSYRAYFSISSQVNKESDTTMDRALTAYSGDYEYRNIAYDKGVILFDRVRQVAGEKNFYAALKRYKSQYEGKIASAEEFVECFSRAGANVGALIASFTEGRCVI